MAHRAAGLFPDARGNSGAEEGVATSNFTDGFDEVGRGGLLNQVTGSSGTDGRRMCSSSS